jgi:hypothetical protein
MQRPTWPSEEVSMQMHMDFRVPTIEELRRHRERAEDWGRLCVEVAPGVRAKASMPSTSAGVPTLPRSICTEPDVYWNFRHSP